MLSITDLANAIVGKLRSVPGLVAAMGGDPSRIFAYHDAWPASSYLQAALIETAAPAMIIVWRSTGPGQFGRGEVWQHEFSVIIRPPEALSGAASYADILRLIVDGVPGAGTIKLLNDDIHAGCYPMNVPNFARQTLIVAPESGLDYFEARIVLVEIGDQ